MVLKHCNAAVIAASLIVSAFPAHAQEAHGSIAVGHTAYGESVAYGFAWNHVTKDEAREAALNACRAGGGADCAERTWFQNGCGALAIGQYGNGGAKAAMTRDQAEARAVQTCEARGGSGCTVVGSQCASPGGEAGTWSGSEQVLAAPEVEVDHQQAEVQTEAVEARNELLTREQRVQVQQGLTVLGFDPGPADGLFGPKTRAAIWDWQDAKGMDATGYLSREQSEALGAISQQARVQYEQPASQSEVTSVETPEEDEAKPTDSQNIVLHFPQCGENPDIFSGCWRAISNQPDCDFFATDWDNFWDNEAQVLEPVTWSGGCRHNVAHGRGTMKASSLRGGTWGGKAAMESVGEFVEGKRHGHWIIRFRYADGHEEDQEGLYVKGFPHGIWVEHFRRPGSSSEEVYRLDFGTNDE